MTNKNEYEFQKLTPINNVDNIDAYREALDFVFKNEDLRNVALSGSYGSGKSSVLESYKKYQETHKHKKLKFLHISLAHFESIEENTDTKIRKSVLEGKVLNQLIHQINPKDIPQTSFGLKYDASKRKLFIYAGLLVLFMLLLSYVIFAKQWPILEHSPFYVAFAELWQPSQNSGSSLETGQESLESLPETGLQNSINSPQNVFLSFIIIACVFLAITFLYEIFKLQLSKGIIKKIGTHNIEIEMFKKENDDSNFDKYLKEVLYLFELSKADVVVFEDIDRHDTNQIFELLREVNTLINLRKLEKINFKPFRLRERVKCEFLQLCDLIKRKFLWFFQRQNQPNFKPLRFFYLLRDDIFTSNDRTKFFDFIIPIVPIVSGSNSYKKFTDDNKRFSEKFDDSFLRGLLIFIDDMRVLKNIYNEFMIYDKRLNVINIKSDGKNIQNSDSNSTQDFNGENIQVYDSDNTQNFNSESAQGSDGNITQDFDNENTQDSISKSTDKLENNKMMAMITYKNLFPRDFNELQLNKGFIFTLFNHKEWFFGQDKQRLLSHKQKEVIYTKDVVLQQKLETEIAELKNVITQIKNDSLRNLIAGKNISEIFTTPIKNDIGIKLDFKDIHGNSYLGLLKFLISDGYIDESYTDYMTYSYKHSLNRVDEIFIRNIKSQEMMDPYCRLTEPHNVVEWLGISDFDKPSVLNFDLFYYLLNLKTRKHKKYLDAFFVQLKRTKNYDFVKNILHEKEGIEDANISGILKKLIETAIRIPWEAKLQLFEFLSPKADENEYKQYYEQLVKLIEIDMVLVEGGTFIMGSIDQDANANEKPTHSVTLHDYYIGKYPVTQRQWVSVMGNNPSSFKGDDLPVEDISWDEVQRFIKKLNQITSKKYRMLTEAEWEYAARGGAKSKNYKYSGSDDIDEIAWYRTNSSKTTHPVGIKKANELGLHDMSGNVWEWVHDWYMDYNPLPQTYPQGPSSGSARIRRGGSWDTSASQCRVSSRWQHEPNNSSSVLGFRLGESK